LNIRGLSRRILVKSVFFLITCICVAFILSLSLFHTSKTEGKVGVINKWDYYWGEAPGDAGSLSSWLMQTDTIQGWQTVQLPNHLQRSQAKGNLHELWVRTILPVNPLGNISLSLQVYGNYEVYANQHLIYTFGNLDANKRLRYNDTPQRLISIPNGALGKLFYIHIYSSSNHIGFMSNPLIGTRSDLTIKNLYHGTSKFLIGFLCMVSGFIFLMIAYFFRKSIFFSFSMFLLFFGLYNICRSQLTYLIFDVPSVWSYTELIATYIWVSFLPKLIEQMFGSGYKQILRRLWQINIAYVVVSIVFILLKVITEPQALDSYLFIIAITIVGILSHTIFMAFQGNREAVLISIGIVIVAISSLFDLIKDSFAFMEKWSNMIYLCVFILICILIYLFTKRLLGMITVMKQSEKMAAIGHLAAGVAHEIRNPMTVISGFLQFIHKDIKNQLHFQIIMSEIKRINDMIDDFLLFNSPNKVVLTKNNLLEIIQETMILFQPKLTDGLLSIDLAAQENLPYVLCDADKIKQVLINLIKNAVEAMDGVGKVLITVSCDHKNAFQIKITDHGAGISPEQIQNIWQPFFTTKGTGTGLGLMISLKIVELHKGTIHVQSKKSEGTSFTIELPME